ncbi:CBS domain-containing protein [Streptomyces anulatus]|uniref:CBS domain-containing protein n=1 Tax=Streptomyces anulatus TaxID=1892 RepID=A0A7K3RGL4_STRAQ|nr:CBS domain-containing protein [Streptomyces anulatus]NEC01340.1 CBS domain-containing protein [Streptomyces anulatus]NED28590.1 CBS domain-containing protein [Streptomyces anulatus]
MTFAEQLVQELPEAGGRLVKERQWPGVGEVAVKATWTPAGSSPYRRLESQIAVRAGGAEPDEAGTSAVTRLTVTTSLSAVVQSAADAAGHLADEDARARTVAYRVSNLDSANRMPESVRVGDSLGTAMTLMVLRDYSQLPVLDTDGRLRGVISWESIGLARMADPQADLAAATVRAQEADRSDDLLDWIVTIQKSG